MNTLKKHFQHFWKHSQDGNTGALYIVVIFALLTMAAIVFTGGLEVSPKEAGTGTQINVTPYNPEGSKTNLQLYTFFGASVVPTKPVEPTMPPTGTTKPPPSVTLPPPTGGVCKRESPMINCSTCPVGEMKWLFCQENPCEGFNTSTLGPLGTFVSQIVPKNLCVFPQFHQKFSERVRDPACTAWCLGKPVIYLYPTEDTLVDVLIDVPGKIVVSDPLYPEGGWKQVLAHPSGELNYQGKSYRELFFESEVDTINEPGSGIIIPVANLKTELDKLITKLGLIGDEKTEFIEFWVPRLEDLHAPYILFSVLDRVEKERVDHVIITPKPDTFISFIAYFKPLAIPYTGLPTLELPKTPQRIGFTAVEWGGTIASANGESSPIIIGR